MLVIRKKEPKKGQKVLLEGKLVRNIRFCAMLCTSYPKKCTCFPIGDVRDRRRERYNRVYVQAVYVQTEFHCIKPKFPQLTTFGTRFMEIAKKKKTLRSLKLLSTSLTPHFKSVYMPAAVAERLELQWRNV